MVSHDSFSLSALSKLICKLTSGDAICLLLYLLPRDLYLAAYLVTPFRGNKWLRFIFLFPSNLYLNRKEDEKHDILN